MKRRVLDVRRVGRRCCWTGLVSDKDLSSTTIVMLSYRSLDPSKDI